MTYLWTGSSVYKVTRMEQSPWSLACLLGWYRLCLVSGSETLGRCHVPYNGKVYFSLKVACSERGRRNEGHPPASAFLAFIVMSSDLAGFFLSSPSTYTDYTVAILASLEHWYGSSQVDKSLCALVSEHSLLCSTKRSTCVAMEYLIIQSSSRRVYAQ